MVCVYVYNEQIKMYSGNKINLSCLPEEIMSNNGTRFDSMFQKQLLLQRVFRSSKELEKQREPARPAERDHWEDQMRFNVMLGLDGISFS